MPSVILLYVTLYLRCIPDIFWGTILLILDTSQVAKCLLDKRIGVRSVR